MHYGVLLIGHVCMAAWLHGTEWHSIHEAKVRPPSPQPAGMEQLLVWCTLPCQAAVLEAMGGWVTCSPVLKRVSRGLTNLLHVDQLCTREASVFSERPKLDGLACVNS